MSILQEFEQIRKGIGEVEFNHIELFLSVRKDLFLSDVYYDSDVYAQFEAWKRDNNLI
jgi:hypothetical protein